MLPSERITFANQAARCQHLKTNGEPCRCPARTGQIFCHFHDQAHAGPSLEIPLPEDWTSIQLGVFRILRGLMDETCDPVKAGRALYGLQIAAMNLNRFQRELPQAAPEAGASLVGHLLRKMGLQQRADATDDETLAAAALEFAPPPASSQ